jgi:hypothetical protein
MLGQLDELHAGSVAHQFLIDVHQGAVRDSTFDDHRLVAEFEAELVKRVQIERKVGLGFESLLADFEDRQRLKQHHLARERAEHRKTFSFAPVGIRSGALLIRVSHGCGL